MSRRPGSKDSLLVSYLALRKAIGIIGAALPFALAVGMIFLGDPTLLDSISAYYYTAMRDVLVGSLCAIAVFLFSYQGYERRDNIAGNLACVFALGVALCPTTPELQPAPGAQIVGTLHLMFATALFLTLAYFSLALFRKTNTAKTPTPRKLQRNLVYTVCGYVILACIAMIAVVALLGDESPVQRLRPVFWLEATAIVAFGVSWLTKGETILGDVS